MRDPQKSAAAWVQGLANATQKIQDGINAVTVNPNQLAAAASNKYLMNTAAAVNSGRYAAANNAVPPGYWKQQFLAKISRVAAGAQTAMPKMAAFLQKLKPQMDQLQASIHQMPSDTYDQRKMRANALMDGMHALKGSFK